MTLKKRILVISLLLILVVSFFGTAFSQTASDAAKRARASALKELSGSIEGTPREAPRIFTTKEGYLRFIGAPPSTHFAVAPGTPEQAADVFLEQWRNLFVNASPAVGFDVRDG